MSYLLISDFVDAGKKAIKNNNYWGALAIALMLPSLCSRLEFENNESYFERKSDGSKKWHDKKAYVDWCNKNFKERIRLKELIGAQDYNFLYNLRCDIVHAGRADIEYNEKAIYFITRDDRMYSTYLGERIIVSVKDFSEEIFAAVISWISNHSMSRYRYTFIFDGNNRDDMLLYNSLYDESRLEVVRKEFDDFESKSK